MSEWRILINKTGSSNKFWKFRFTNGGCSVEKVWGRIGGNEDTQTKEFAFPSQAQRYAEGEVSKKLAKGYAEATTETLEEETDVAQTIGTRWKIDRIEFLGQIFDPNADSQSLTIGSEYNPDCGVYVELLESWDKSRVRMLLTKKTAMQYLGGSATPTRIEVSAPSYPQPEFVTGIRKAIHKLAEVVSKIVTVNFAAVGNRVLDLFGDEGETVKPEYQTMIGQAVAKSGASVQAVSKFAAMGSRALEL
jgi:predicted DNA-binding WGR domain protein